MSGPSTDRPVGYTLRWYETQRPSHAASALGRHAYSIGRAVGRWMTDPPVSVRVTRHPQPQDGGSSLIARGVVGSRSWCVIGWSSSGYLGRTLGLSGYIWEDDRSADGPDGFRTSGSSRSWSVEANITGTAAATLVEEER